MFPFALQAFSGLQAGVALLTQLLEATVLLMLLDKLAAAIRLTYQAGRLTGRLWYTYGVPAVLWLADTISWLWSKIDWAAVLQTVVRAGCAVIAAFQVVRSRWVAWHDVVPTVRPSTVITATVTRTPLTVDQLIAQHTQRELMAMAGTKSKRSKKILAEKILKNS